jgi:RNase adapter protein RapZ
MSATPRRVVLVTGLSGAGKASILRVLEDLGFETVDNPPWPVLEALIAEGGAQPLAAGVDARTRALDAGRVGDALARLKEQPGLALEVVYATASEDVLLRRFSETRRRHPLAPSGRVADGIAREVEMLRPLREAADLLVDTSDRPLHDLRRLIERRYGAEEVGSLAVTVLSFGFPKGLPREADIVMDLRFLRNPHYEPALRPLTGKDPAVGAHVEADPDWAGFWDRMTALLDPLLPRYLAEGKKYLTVALGCTGGQHRSVHAAERLARHWGALGWKVELTHRELVGRETGRAPQEGRPEHARA